METGLTSLSCDKVVLSGCYVHFVVTTADYIFKPKTPNLTNHILHDSGTDKNVYNINPVLHSEPAPVHRLTKLVKNAKLCTGVEPTHCYMPARCLTN